MSPVSICVYILFLWSTLAEVKRKLTSLTLSQRGARNGSLGVPAEATPPCQLPILFLPF